MSTVPMKTPPTSGGGGGGLLAARVGDMHICPIIPHVGGVVLPPGKPTVFIEGKPAARVGDLCKCEIGPPDAIAKGSPTVFIGGKMAARITDPTVHGGFITIAAARTYIGNGNGKGSAADCMKKAAANASATVST